jgi:hypothetical protein
MFYHDLLQHPFKVSYSIFIPLLYAQRLMGRFGFSGTFPSSQTDSFLHTEMLITDFFAALFSNFSVQFSHVVEM